MSGRICFFDLETGGLEPERHPIIQIAAVAVDASSFEEIETLEMLVQFDEKTADEKALAINNYDPARWRERALDRRRAIDTFNSFLKRHSTVTMTSKAGKPYRVAKLAGHNAASFDGPFLRSWYKRTNEFLPADPRVLCTMQLAAWIYAARGETPKSLKLGDCCASFSVELAVAHDALHDVRATAALGRKLIETMRLVREGS